MVSRSYSQGRDFLELLPRTCPNPSRREAPADEASPTRSQDLLREAATVQKTLPECEYRQRKVTAILRMKVRRVVIVEEHLDHNAEETADLRHGWAGRVVREKCLPVSCRLP